MSDFVVNVVFRVLSIKFPAGAPKVPQGTHISDMDYCPELRILAVTFSDGTAAILTSARAGFDKEVCARFCADVDLRAVVVVNCATT